MLSMPAVAEAGSVVKYRARFQELPAESEAVESAEMEANGGGGAVSSANSSQGFELQEDPSFWKDHNVQVVIRIRPLSSSEISLQGYSRCVRQESCQAITWTGHPESRFTFDLVADEHISQEKLFKVAGVPMVENCVAGYNSCMFAYGQTGSGKTHTMLGDIEGGTRRHSVNCGMTPRVFEYMFSRIQKEKEARRDEKLQFSCKCSFLEIYNEQILDLLDPSDVNLQLREDAKKGVHVENLTEIEVSSARDVMQQLVQGAANRKVAATNMNRASSRSHSVFTCVIESKWESQGINHHRFARLNLVDLAGSERQKSSGAEGDRLKEATNINKSLSTLGLVIMNLVSISNKKSLHVPYRDSKLTFLLQDSLGGNSKTIIIANISPSNCCGLETLSTLKFAQRAKFIKNNAIVNEDASGDIIAMRLQIQQLKKEVNRLQGLVNCGTENSGCDGLSAYISGSPGSFKWDGLQGSSSPLTFDKRLSQRKEYEAALVAAFRRDQDKEAALKALSAGKQAAEQLATQRTEEIRSLKMRLRFREEGIKRLQAVASDKLSAEAHLLQQREELVKEIEALRNQVDRNPEITRFAMENLHLKEELRRLQSFVEEGEREMLNEQITVLQDKLLEALDWKLMHEKDMVAAQDQLSFNWDSSVNEENEFLCLEAIQNQREVETLRKNLTFCLEAKEKLERRVDDLVSQLEEQRKAFNAPADEIQNPQTSSLISSEENESSDDQMELKAMVDAIAAASQREAEAHESTITLAKENEELRMKLKVLLEDNNKLIELYESTIINDSANQTGSGHQIEGTGDLHANSANSKDGHEHIYEEAKDVDYLEHQLLEMHEENEKLLGLYEKAMQERDELKRLVSSYNFDCSAEAKEGIKFEEKHIRGEDEKAIHTQDNEKLQELLGLYENVIEERDELKKMLSSYELSSKEVHEAISCDENAVEVHDERVAQKQVQLGEPTKEKLHLASTKLELVQNELAAAGEAVKYLGLLEKAAIEVEKLFDNIDTLDHSVQLKQQEITSLKSILSKAQDKRTIMENKFSALKVALQCFSSKIHYWESREERARARVKSCSGGLVQKKEELRRLQIRRDEVNIAGMKARQLESELVKNIEHLKKKFHEAETQKKQTERVLFAIDNVDKPDLSGKASELLKFAEVSAEMKKLWDRLSSVRKEIANTTKISESLDAMIQSLEAGINTGLHSLQEAEFGLRNIVAEKDILFQMIEDGRTAELSNIIAEYQECIFESSLKEEEIKLCEETLQLEMKSLEELRVKHVSVSQNLNYLLEESKCVQMLSNSDGCQQYISEKVEVELGNVQTSLAEAKSLLLSCTDR